MERKRWSKPLPSDVVEDSDFDSVLESRVPTLGLPHLPGNNQEGCWNEQGKAHVWGKQQQDSRCDSGVFDSFQCGGSSVRSSYADGGTTLDSVDETCLRDRLKSLSIQHWQQQQTPERLQQQDSRCDSGVFDSFQSGASSVRSSYADYADGGTKIVFPPDLPTEEPEARVQHHRGEYDDSGDEISDKVLEIFLGDQEGDT